MKNPGIVHQFLLLFNSCMSKRFTSFPEERWGLALSTVYNYKYFKGLEVLLQTVVQ